MPFLPAYVVCIVEPPAGGRPRGVAHGSVRNGLVGWIYMMQLVREGFETSIITVCTRYQFSLFLIYTFLITVKTISTIVVTFVYILPRYYLLHTTCILPITYYMHTTYILPTYYLLRLQTHSLQSIISCFCCTGNPAALCNSPTGVHLKCSGNTATGG